MKKTSLSLAALGVAGTLILTGCNGGAYSSLNTTYAKQDCTASSDESNGVYPTTDGTGVRVEHDGDEHYVMGQVWVTCDPSPIQHILDVELWYLPAYGDGGFRKIDSHTYKSIPSQSSQTAYAVVSDDCVAGLYKVEWSVVGRDQNGEPYTYKDTWTYAYVKSVDCTDEGPEPTVIATEGGPVVPE